MSKHLFVNHCFQLVTLLYLLGCLLIPFATRTFLASNAVMYGAYTAFIVLLCIVCIDISNFFNQHATRVFGTAFATMYLGELAGNGLAALMTASSFAVDIELSLVTLVLALVVAVSTLFIFTERDLAETSLGEMIDDEEDEKPAASEPSLDAERRIACITALFVKRYALTPREADVLPLVIKGRTIARIQEELHISQGTVSTHTRHIYQKAGVYNRQDLLDLIDAIPQEELAGTLVQ